MLFMRWVCVGRARTMGCSVAWQHKHTHKHTQPQIIDDAAFTLIQLTKSPAADEPIYAKMANKTKARSSAATAAASGVAVLVAAAAALLL